VNDADVPGVGSLPVLLAYHINLLSDHHEAAWRAGRRPRIEDFLTLEAEPGRTVLLRELLAAELAARRQGGETPDRQEYHDRFPGDTALIAAVFAEAEPTCAGLATPSQKQPVAGRTEPAEGADRETRDLSGNDRAHETGETVQSPAHYDPTGLGGTGSSAAPVREAIATGQRFRILRRHVRGGLGEVFVAFDQELRREVALKEIRPEHAGQASSQARFLLEAEITGGLEHPGIVPVYGLGRYADGRPYYAMRFVQGHTLKEAIAQFHGVEGPRRDPSERTLGLRQLLRRFVDVCNALAYAHSRGVLHRDLKPANILLGPFGETLIVDWGLAKPIDGPDEARSQTVSPLRPSLAGDSTLTHTGSALGTPSFMSPEQAAGRFDRVGPASDVYSLGATLYCVLTGRPPIEERDIDDAVRKAQAGNFPPPRQVQREVDAGLEAICLKAMAGEPEDRYPSPLALAEDLEHWLADEPVSARREPFNRRARRWARRHRTAVAAAVVALIAGVVGIGTVAGVQARANGRLQRANDVTNAALAVTRQAQAQTQEALAQSEESRQQAEAVSTFLVEAFRSPDPTRDGRQVKVADVLDRASGRIDQIFAGSQATKGTLLDALGRTYDGLGLYDRAVSRHAHARDVREAALGPDHPATLTSRDNLAVAYKTAGRTAEAITLNEETLKLKTSRFGPDHPDTLLTRNNLAVAYSEAGRTAEAIALHDETLKLNTSKLGPDHSETFVSRNNLAHAYQIAGRTAEAIALHEETLKLRTSKLGPDHPHTLHSRNNLAESYRTAGRTAKAIALHEETLKLRTAKLGPDHPDTLTSRNNLALAYRAAGRMAEAIAMHEETLRLRTTKLGSDHPRTLNSRHNLANAYRIAGRTAEAIAIWEAMLPAAQKTFGPGHPSTLTFINRLATAHESLGRWAEAEDLYRDTLARRRGTTKPDSPLLADDLAALGHHLLAQSRWSEAEPLLREGLSIRDEAAPDDWRRYDAMSLVGGSLLGQGRYADAEPRVIAGYEGMKTRESRIAVPERSRLLEAAERVVRLYEQWNKPEQATLWKAKLRMRDLPADVFVPGPGR
jgi:eukaryotic-like serine/threonine-protein kinase